MGTNKKLGLSVPAAVAIDKDNKREKEAKKAKKKKKKGK